MSPPSYPHYDDSDLSLLRLVLISEILCADETVLVLLADVWRESGLLASADAPPVRSPPDILPLLRPVQGLHKDSCKSGHRTWMEVLSHIIRAVLGGIILPMARLIRAVGHDPIG